MVAEARAQDALRTWRQYSSGGDPRLRERLVLTFAPLVRHIVYRKLRELPASCEAEDLLSSGVEGLMGAIDRYDERKGATLEQFLWTRIHGAVLDELRRADWAPRSVRRWERDIARARETFTAVHGREPSKGELAEALAIDRATLRERQDDIATSELTSLTTLTVGAEQGRWDHAGALASQDLRVDPESAATLAAAKERFRRAFARLPRRDREVAVLLYVKNLTLRETGEVVGVSESRVCQIHDALKRKLLAELERDAELFADAA